MLDKKTDAVLELLAEKAGNGYKVLNKNQIISELPKKYNVDVQTLHSILAFLKENEYVDVKYQDKEEICLAVTVKAESYVDGEKNMTQKAKITTGQIGILFVVTFVAALLGALVATLIGKLF